MTCRKSDIDKYENDIKVLEEASSIADSVITRQTNIGNYLTNLQTAYGDTVKASDDFISEFHKLDEGADSSASGIKTKIDEALQDARDLLTAAINEEKDCPIHHPKSDQNNLNIQCIM